MICYVGYIRMLDIKSTFIVIKDNLKNTKLAQCFGALCIMQVLPVYFNNIYICICMVLITQKHEKL